MSGLQEPEPQLRLRGKPFFSCRVTQIYTSGVCIYFYLALSSEDLAHPTETFAAIENAARAEILAAGGPPSHHHGVGKIRKGFMERTLPKMAIDWQAKIKDAIDPNNVFAINNTVYRSEEERKAI